jgi:hypothetical protein
MTIREYIGLGLLVMISPFLFIGAFEFVLALLFVLTEWAMDVVAWFEVTHGNYKP